MCGIFGQISNSKINKDNLKKLVNHSKQRGMDSSGLIYFSDDSYKINRADIDIEKLLNKVNLYDYKLVLGHSRLITNGLGDNQPVVRGNICALHNGIIVNEKDVWSKLTVDRKYRIDSEVIVAIAEEHLNGGGEIADIPNKVLSLSSGVVACAMLFPGHGKYLFCF
jgi:glucosamine--fructose-6-phosphate aminotransferase (isomerizing)